MFFFGKKNGSARQMSMAEAKAALEGDKSICLIDVRTPQEYQDGHIPGSVNLPLGSMEGITSIAPEHDKKLFVYCLSGARAARACAELAGMGYTDISDLGGINNWTGLMERKG
ncbi:Rhodanese domain protein [uncultured Eubacteriales bacterium]|uniref:Rhodanese domain protein n=1 Tax=uncultured Eubacteriales bacterium TaxID=172733 RepID=A0A212KB54_9FIRM|nr:Rhodanese domain protein [uncultured Eubacteriales bacterium]